MAIEALTPLPGGDVRAAVVEALDTLHAIDGSPASLSDAALIAATHDIEALGRAVDALRVSFAGEIADRSVRHGDDEGLAARHGCRNAVEMLQRVTLTAPRTVNERLRLAKAVRSRISLVGEELPPALPATAEALLSGEIGVDAALSIADILRDPAKVCPTEHLLAAEGELAAAAAGRHVPDDGDGGKNDLPDGPAPQPCTVDELRIQARVWAQWLDQDGTEPAAERAERQRSFVIGAERDGLIPIRGNLVAEGGGQLRRLFDAYLNPAQGVRFAPDGDGDSSGDSGPETPLDLRSRTQKQHDALVAILGAAARAVDAPQIGGAAPTVLITVGENDLATGTGAAHIEGVETPVPVTVAQRHICAHAAQKVVFDDDGAIISLGSPTRLFTAHQRRAIIARDGGCIIPGCAIPAGWCEVHHVIEHSDDGKTHTDNGTLLCWWHHHHLAASGWEIRMIRGVPHVRGPDWIDPAGRFRPATSSHSRLKTRHRRRRGAPPRPRPVPVRG